MSEDPLPLRILEVRTQVAELSSMIRPLWRSGLDDAGPRLLMSRKRVQLEDLKRQTNQLHGD